MRILIFGAGGLSKAISDSLHTRWDEVLELSKAQCDVRDYMAVLGRVDQQRPDFIINCAGLSDLVVGTTMREVVDTNLIGAINVSLAGKAWNIPTLLIGSTAGMQAPEQHPWYGPAKAGVIAHVAAQGKAGYPIWCLSPNRIDTPMRENDWPGEDRRTRLNPRKDVVPVVSRIMDFQYPRGANVVVRKVGLRRVDVFQAPTVVMQGML